MFVKREKLRKTDMLIEILENKINAFANIVKKIDILPIVGTYVCCKLLSLRYCKYFSSFLIARCSKNSFILSSST